MVAYRRITPNDAFIQTLIDMQDRVGSLETRPAGNIVVREQLTTTDPATGVSTVLGQLPDGSVGLQQWVGDIVPPDQPSAPSVTSVDSMISVTWDGLDISGVTPPVDYDKTVVEMSLDGSTGWTKVDELRGKSVAYINGQTAGATRYFRLVSLDQNGNRSTPSATVTGAAKTLAQDPSIVTAMATAGGGNTIVHSDVTPPVPTNGWKNGDVWYKHATSNITSKILSWYIWNGAWTQQALDETFLPQVNIGTGTYGYLTGSQIKAQTITVDKLAITSTDNLIAEANFSNSGTLWQTGVNNYISATAGRGGTPAMRFTGTTSAVLTKNLLNRVTVGSEDRFRASMWLSSSSSAASGVVSLIGRCYTTATAYTDVTFVTNASLAAGVWSNVSGISPVLPVGTIALEFLISVTNASAGTTLDVDYVAVTRAADGKLVVDGAIDGKTITGATIQTAPSGARIVLDQTSLNAWNSNGDNYFNMSNATGVNISSIGTGGFDVTRINYCTNPSFEVDISGWTSSQTIVRDTAQFYVGTASLKATHTATADRVVSRKQARPTTNDYSVSAYVFHNAATAKNMQINLYYTDGSNVPVTGGTFTGTPVSVPPNTWTRVFVGDNGAGWPGSASNVRTDIVGTGFASTETMWVDAVLWEAVYSSNANTYFDGSTTGSGKISYVWEGSTGLSYSDQRTDRDIKIKTGGNNVLLPGNNYSKQAVGVGFIPPSPYMQTAGLFSDGQVVSLIEGASDPQLARIDVGNQQINTYSRGDTALQTRGRIYLGASLGNIDLYSGGYDGITMNGSGVDVGASSFTGRYADTSTKKRIPTGIISKVASTSQVAFSTTNTTLFSTTFAGRSNSTVMIAVHIHAASNTNNTYAGYNLNVNGASVTSYTKPYAIGGYGDTTELIGFCDLFSTATFTVTIMGQVVVTGATVSIPSGELKVTILDVGSL